MSQVDCRLSCVYAEWSREHYHLQRQSAPMVKRKEVKPPVELPEEIVDQLRAERGGIVDHAVETGRIVVIPRKRLHQLN